MPLIAVAVLVGATEVVDLAGVVAVVLDHDGDDFGRGVASAVPLRRHGQEVFVLERRHARHKLRVSFARPLDERIDVIASARVALGRDIVPTALAVAEEIVDVDVLRDRSVLEDVPDGALAAFGEVTWTSLPSKRYCPLSKG